MFLLRPHGDRDRDGQHGEAHDGESGNCEHKITHQSVQHAEMLATQGETPLQQEQCEE